MRSSRDHPIGQDAETYWRPGEDVEHKDYFDFERLNPHQTFIQEFMDTRTVSTLTN